MKPDNNGQEPVRNIPLGTLAALGMIVVWSSWLVISRAGAKSSITPYDLAAIRYGVASVVALPIVLYFKPWRQMTVFRMAVVTFLMGPAYVLAIFAGFEVAPASHGGIFMNGAFPIITLVIAWMWLSDRPRKRQAVAALIILGGIALIVGDESFDITETWTGDIAFLIAGVFFCLYVAVSREWNVTTTQVLMCSAVFNSVLFVPVWYFFLPSGLAEAPLDQFWLQILFQGLVPNLVGLLLIALAARHIGPTATSTYMSLVPAMGAIFGALFLGETLGLVSWSGVAVLTAGIILMSVKRTR